LNLRSHLWRADVHGLDAINLTLASAAVSWAVSPPVSRRGTASIPPWSKKTATTRCGRRQRRGGGGVDPADESSKSRRRAGRERFPLPWSNRGARLPERVLAGRASCTSREDAWLRSPRLSRQTLHAEAREFGIAEGALVGRLPVSSANLGGRCGPSAWSSGSRSHPAATSSTATPSLAWNQREPLCGPPLPQVVPDRRGRSYRFSSRGVMRSPSRCVRVSLMKLVGH
jgi:hypothetical protein